MTGHGKSVELLRAVSVLEETTPLNPFPLDFTEL